MSDISPVLATLRERIDAVDDEIVGLLLKRASIALEVKEAKKDGKITVYSPQREREILERVRANATGGDFPLPALENIFTNIISAGRSLQNEMSVAYLGPTEASFAYHAAIKQFGDSVSYSAVLTLDELFARVERGDVHYAVVPDDYSRIAGKAEYLHRLMNADVQIIAEVSCAQRVVLCGVEKSIAKAKKVYGNPQLVALSSSWISVNLPEVELVVDNTLSSYQEMIQEDGVVVLALEATAERLGLPIIASGLEDAGSGEMRFLVLSREEASPTAPGEKCKTTLVCSVEDRSGILREILKPFASRAITLLGIHSYPIRHRSWEYVFLIEVVGHKADAPLVEVVDELGMLVTEVAVLGSYPISSLV